jgi:hypothetical protein
MGIKRVFIFLCVLCCAALFAAVPSHSEPNGTEKITGTVVAIGGRFGGRSRQFTLTIKRYTAPNQLRELNEALNRGGQDDLLKVMSKMDAGRVQIGTGVGVPANAVIVDPWGDGGRKITVLYERWLQFFELRYGTRSQDYPIGYAEIFLDHNGKGEGRLIPAARVRSKGENTWEVEDYGTFPARLMGLRSHGQVVPR